VKLVASTIDGTALANVSGGNAADSGKLILGRNVTGTNPVELPEGGLSLEIADADGHNAGPRQQNPYVAGWQTQTPLIPNLVDGADAFGLTELTAESPELASMLSGRPSYAVAALCLMDEGPASLAHAWDGFDMLLLVNLTPEPLVNPALGVGAPGLLVSLAQGGFARQATFGGDGYTYLEVLGGGQVYALLVPEGSAEFSLLACGCELAHTTQLKQNEAIYMIPEPSALVLLTLGLGTILHRRGGRL